MTDLPQTFQEAIPLLVAGLGGLAVGIEREWSARAEGRAERFAGVRTFLLIGLSGGLGGLLIKHSMSIAGAALMAGAVLLIVSAYFVTAFRGHIDATTEVAALLVFGAGAFAAAGQLTLASAINALTALVLVEKSRMHALVYRLQSMELEAGARFAVMALVILPLLPPGPFGPSPGFRPRALWAMVLIFSGLNFTAYIARKVIGPERGYRAAGLLGGLVSSTGVTLTFARESRSESSMKKALAYGVIGACTILMLRVPLLLTVFNRPMALSIVPYVVIPFITGALLFLRSFRTEEGSKDMPALPNPLGLKSAMTMAVLFQGGLYLVSFVSERFGNAGTFVTAALLGLTDVDALIFSMINLTFDPSDVTVAVQAIAIGAISNTFLKFILALTIGKGEFRKIAGTGLAILLAAAIVGFFVALLY